MGGLGGGKREVRLRKGWEGEGLAGSSRNLFYSITVFFFLP